MAPRRLLLDMAREHAPPKRLRLVVGNLAESPRVALVRIWLVQKSEDCGGCRMSLECPDRSACLHLAASAGRSAVDAKVESTRLDGAFRRFPLGVRKVGRSAATGEPLEEANNIRAALRRAEGQVEPSPSSQRASPVTP